MPLQPDNHPLFEGAAVEDPQAYINDVIQFTKSKLSSTKDSEPKDEDGMMCDVFRQGLHGKAKKWYDQLSGEDRQNWDSLQSALKIRFLLGLNGTKDVTVVAEASITTQRSDTSSVAPTRRERFKRILHRLKAIKLRRTRAPVPTTCAGASSRNQVPTPTQSQPEERLLVAVTEMKAKVEAREAAIKMERESMAEELDAFRRAEQRHAEHRHAVDRGQELTDKIMELHREIQKNTVAFNYMAAQSRVTLDEDEHLSLIINLYDSIDRGQELTDKIVELHREDQANKDAMIKALQSQVRDMATMLQQK